MGEWERESETIHYFRTARLTICVHRHLLANPDDWLVSCQEAGIDKHPLAMKGLDDAKVEAIEEVHGRLLRFASSLDPYVPKPASG